MNWLALIGWIFKCTFSCNHLRTPINEGQCYCPDCGQGLVYQWVVLRCTECRVRRESRYYLRHVVPAQRCCVWCGHDAVQVEFLETPLYFQLNQARLIVQEAQQYLDGRAAAWTICALEQGWQTARQWLLTSTRTPSTELTRLPVRIRF